MKLIVNGEELIVHEGITLAELLVQLELGENILLSNVIKRLSLSENIPKPSLPKATASKSSR